MNINDIRKEHAEAVGGRKQTTYCCRFEKHDGCYTCEFLTGYGITLREAKAAARQTAKERDDLVRVDSVYPMEEDEE